MFLDKFPLQLSKGALFLGKAMVRSATVAGRLEGILVVSDMLTMRGSGHCDGVLRYGQLNVQVRFTMWRAVFPHWSLYRWLAGCVAQCWPFPRLVRRRRCLVCCLDVVAVVALVVALADLIFHTMVPFFSAVVAYELEPTHFAVSTRRALDCPCVFVFVGCLPRLSCSWSVRQRPPTLPLPSMPPSLPPHGLLAASPAATTVMPLLTVFPHKQHCHHQQQQ